MRGRQMKLKDQVAVVDRFGRIDILVNNVAISDNKHIFDITEEEWDRVLAVTLKSQFLMGKHVAQQMAAQGTLLILVLFWLDFGPAPIQAAVYLAVSLAMEVLHARITGAPLNGLPPFTMALGPSISISAPSRANSLT